MLRPIKRLPGSAKAVSKGDLTVKMETGRKDEVGELAKYFERMVDNLRMMILGVQETTEQVSAFFSRVVCQCRTNYQSD